MPGAPDAPGASGGPGIASRRSSAERASGRGSSKATAAQERAATRAQAPSQGLVAQAVAPQAGPARRAAFACARTVAGTLLAAGALWGLAAICGLEVPLAMVWALAFAGAAIASAGAMHPRSAVIAPVVVALACAVALVATGDAWLQGSRALWTCFASTLADASSWRFPELALVDPSSRGQVAALFVAALAFPVGALCAGLCGIRRSWWLALLAPFPLFCVLLCALAIPVAPCVTVVAGAAAAIGATAACEPVAPSAGAAGPMRAACAVLVAVCAMAGAGVLALAVPPSTWSQLQPLSAARAALGGAVHDLRYGTPANALPDGCLDALSGWTADSGAVALRLSSDAAPEPAYLRGFVGATRDAHGWEALPEADYHASDALFWGLHEDGFSPLTQLGAAIDASMGNDEVARQLAALRANGESGEGAASPADAGMTDAAESASGSAGVLAALSEKAASVSVETRAASSEWLYLPYGLDGLNGALPAAQPAQPQVQPLKDRADETAAPVGLFGSRSYSFSYRGSLSTAYPDVASLSWIARDKDAAYWRDESNYNAFAYERYAKNTEADEAAVTATLGEAPELASGHVDYAAAARIVSSWLDANVTYDESYGLPETGANVLADVLTGAKRGWSVHYATAAVAMLRHYGIPARYVEGYLVTPRDIAAATGAGTGAGGTAPPAPSDSQVTIDVPAANGHAWAEMYVDGTGWVPVETVPAVRSVMPQPDWARGLQADGTQRARAPEQQRDELSQSSIDAVQVLQEVLVNLSLAALALLIVFDIIALVFFLVTLVLRLIARHRRRKAFADEDNARAVCSMAGWMADMARYRFPNIAAGDSRALALAVESAYGPEPARIWDEAQAIGRKAAFSQHGATADERMSVMQSARDFAQAVDRGEGLRDRWMIRYIERLM